MNRYTICSVEGFFNGLLKLPRPFSKNDLFMLKLFFGNYEWSMFSTIWAWNMLTTCVFWKPFIIFLPKGYVGHYRIIPCNKDLILCKSCDSFLKLGLNKFGTYFSYSIYNILFNCCWLLCQRVFFPIKGCFFQDGGSEDEESSREQQGWWEKGETKRSLTVDYNLDSRSRPKKQTNTSTFKQ